MNLKYKEREETNMMSFEEFKEILREKVADKDRSGNLCRTAERRTVQYRVSFDCDAEW